MQFGVSGGSPKFIADLLRERSLRDEADSELLKLFKIPENWHAILNDLAYLFEHSSQIIKVDSGDAEWDEIDPQNETVVDLRPHEIAFLRHYGKMAAAFYERKCAGCDSEAAAAHWYDLSSAANDLAEIARSMKV